MADDAAPTPGAAPAAAAPGVSPHLDERFYPDLDTLMTALQDEGTPSGERGLLKYKEIEKFCTKMVTKCKNGSFPDVPKTLAKAKKSMHDIIIRMRKKTSTVEVVESLRKYAKGGEMMYVLANELPNAGWNIILHALMTHWAQMGHKKATERNHNDYLRLSSILLDSTLRDAVQVIFTKKKSKTASNQFSDTVKNFWEEVAGMFNSVEYVAKLPANVDKVDFDNIDPNDVSDCATHQGIINLARRQNCT